MSSASDEAPPPFQSKLPDVEKWFRDRRLHYSKRIEDRLVDEGVEDLEEMKLFDAWPELLRRDEGCPDYYPNVKWKKFEISFATLKKEEFDELKSKPIPIRDNGTGAKRPSENVSSGRKERGSGGNNGKFTIRSFYPTKKQKTRSSSAQSSEEDDDGVEIIDDEQAGTISDPSASIPAIEACNWRSGRDGVDDVEDPPSDLERRQWEKSPMSGLLPAAVLTEKGYTSLASLDDVGGLYQILGASRITSDDEMEQLVKKEEKRRRDVLFSLHPDRPGGDTEKFNEWSNKWDAEYSKAINVLRCGEER